MSKKCKPNHRVQATKKMVILYDDKGNIIGKAGFARSKDFDFDVALTLALTATQPAKLSEE